MGGRSLVLVEDDAVDAILVAEMLSGVAPDDALHTFRTLQAALEDWPGDADCVLLDLGLPDVVGLAAVEALRVAVPDVPVVVLTGRIDDGIGPEALAAGAQDYLVKGQVDGPTLERSVRYAIERGRAAVYERDLVAAELHFQENERLHRGLLPSPLMDGEDLRVATFYRPGSERALLGGDFYDVVETEDRLHLLIGDVSGHGPDEAALGVALRIAWRALVLAGLPAEAVVRGIEAVLLAERGGGGRFATVAMVSTTPDLRRLEVVLCGHPAPLLVRGTAVEELPAAARVPILSLIGGGVVEPSVVEVDGDWGLLLFTDGLVEGRARAGAAERFGVEGLVAALDGALARGVPSDELAATLVAEAEAHHGGALPDDVAIVVAGTHGWWR